MRLDFSSLEDDGNFLSPLPNLKINKIKGLGGNTQALFYCLKSKRGQSEATHLARSKGIAPAPCIKSQFSVQEIFYSIKATRRPYG